MSANKQAPNMLIKDPTLLTQELKDKIPIYLQKDS